MAHGLKSVRAAPYSTRHRGPTGIHACRKRGGPTQLAMKDTEVIDAMARAGIAFDQFSTDGFPANTPFGAIVGTADLIDCVPVEGASDYYLEDQRRYGDYSPGRYLWVFENARALSTPIPARGNVVPFRLEIPTTSCPPWLATGAAGTTSGKGSKSAKKMSSGA